MTSTAATATTVAQTQTEVLLSTLPITTVPPENYRFLPGSSIFVNSTTASSNITNSTAPNLTVPLFNGTGYYVEDEVEPGNFISFFTFFISTWKDVSSF